MIHTVPDFFNKAATELKQKYFPNENHGTTENADYRKLNSTLELFNNGCLTYRAMIGRLAKCCKDTNGNVHEIVEKHIISFGNYMYLPTK